MRLPTLRLLTAATTAGVALLCSSPATAAATKSPKSAKPAAAQASPKAKSAGTTPSPRSSPGASAARRAVAAMQSGDWPEARSQWREVVRLEPGNAGAWSNLGKVEFRLKEYDAACDHLEKAVSLRPALSDSWITLGFVYAELGAPMRAISCLTRAVHENPADPETRNALAIHLKKIGWTSAAESELLKAIDTEPKFAEAHFNLAVMYLEQKPPAVEMARRHYITARQLGAAPDDEMEKQFAPAKSKDPDPTESNPQDGKADGQPSSPPARQRSSP